MKTYSRAALAVLLAVALPAVGVPSDDGSISGDASLNRSMEQYQQSLSGRGDWINPYLPEGVAASQAAGSGDQALSRIVAEFDRAKLDRGGWENPFVPSAAAGSPLLAVRVGDGATVAADATDGVSGDELLNRAVAAYTRDALDRGGWVNPLVGEPHYAAGNPLLAIPVGEGVTTGYARARMVSKAAGSTVVHSTVVQ